MNTKKASKRSTWKYQNIKSLYQNLSEEEKEKKHQYHHEGNKNLSEEQKQKQVEYIRNHYVTN